MGAHPIVVAVLALGACWSKPPPPAPPAPPSPPALAPAKPRGILLVVRLPEGAKNAQLFWNDFDAGATGEIDRNVAWLIPARTNARSATWLSGDGEVITIARPPSGPGVAITELATDRIWAVSPDAKQAVIGCSRNAACQLVKLSGAQVVDDKPIGTTLNYDDGLDLAAWSLDGRLVYQETSPTPTMWFVDPQTDKATRGLKLNRPFTAISDDASLIAWQVQQPHGKYAVRWKRLRDEHEQSVEITAPTIACRFTPVTRQLYCVAARIGRLPDDEEETRNRLIVIDPATGNVREVASDLPLLDTHFTASSPDGRFIAYTAHVDEDRPMIVDVFSGEVFPAGTPAPKLAHVVGWLAPR
jgi:hypothetical protein